MAKIKSQTILAVGQMRERITIQSLSSTQSSTGQPAESWSNLVTVYARVTPERGHESFQAEKMMHESRASFYVRFRGDVTMNMRILWNSLTWNIRAILPFEKKEFMRIIAEEAS